jgi:hypothetical protein
MECGGGRDLETGQRGARGGRAGEAGPKRGSLRLAVPLTPVAIRNGQMCLTATSTPNTAAFISFRACFSGGVAVISATQQKRLI